VVTASERERHFAIRTRDSLSLVNPMFYIVSAFRFGFLGVCDVPVGLAPKFESTQIT
jgi:hypothetical protein